MAKLVERAGESFDRGDYRRSAKLYGEADRAAGGKSLPAVVGLTRANLYLLQYDETIEAARRWIRMAGNPEARAAGYHYLGLGLHWRGLDARWAVDQDHPTARSVSAPSEAGPTAGNDSFRAAADAFRQALEGLGDNAEGRGSALLSLAETLTWLGEGREAAAALDAYEAAGGTDPLAKELRCWAWPGDEEEAEEEGEGDAGEVERAGLPEDVTAPVKRYAPMPEYPPGALAAGMEGEIVLQAVVTKDGLVKCVRPLVGHPVPLAYAAMSTVKTWRFEPARLRGAPVDVYYNLTVNFALRW